METIIDVLDDILGNPEFYHRIGSSTNYSWDYGLMLKYIVAGCILMVVISSVFRFVYNAFKH